jgi:hypothetical protein
VPWTWDTLMKHGFIEFLDTEEGEQLAGSCPAGGARPGEDGLAMMPRVAGGGGGSELAAAA